MAKVSFVDTTLRDGHQCLWATRMSTPMMAPVLERFDRAGFAAVEVMGAVHFDACVRYIKEDPWERLRLMRQRIGRPLQALMRSRCALNFELQPEDINRMWVECLSRNGIDRFVAFDGLHDIDNLADGLLHAKSLGAHTIGWLIFSESPVHTDELYAAKAREFIERANVDALMIEDTGGILLPERLTTLVPAVRAAIGDRPLGLHTHNLVGLGQRVYLEAVRLGVDEIYTCIPPVADGNAPPSVMTTLRNLRYHGHQDNLDDAELTAISEHFHAVAETEGFPKGAPADFDAGNFGHQIPGGVLSNLAAQLEAAGLGNQLDSVLAECARVREELGWPIMVTPFSQLVGVQATLNIIDGERYRRVPDEVKRYALGYYGALLAPVQEDVLDRIMSNGSSSIAEQPPELAPAADALRATNPGLPDEECLLRHAFAPHLLDDRTPERRNRIGATARGLGQLVSQVASRENLGEVRDQPRRLSIPHEVGVTPPEESQMASRTIDHEGLNRPDVQRLKNTAPPADMPFRLDKISHVVLKVQDLERSVKFYTEMLGMQVSDAYPESMMPGRMVFLRYGSDHHGIALLGDAPASSTSSELHHFAFEVTTLDELFAARAYLREKGVHIHFEGRRRAGQQIAIEFADPDGHQLEICWCMDQIGPGESARAPEEWRTAASLEEAVENPPVGQPGR